jgi:hypothetical protein
MRHSPLRPLPGSTLEIQRSLSLFDLPPQIGAATSGKLWVGRFWKAKVAGSIPLGLPHKKDAVVAGLSHLLSGQPFNLGEKMCKGYAEADLPDRFPANSIPFP